LHPLAYVVEPLQAFRRREYHYLFGPGLADVDGVVASVARDRRRPRGDRGRSRALNA
jgi:hypothetical protein